MDVNVGLFWYEAALYNTAQLLIDICTQCTPHFYARYALFIYLSNYEAERSLEVAYHMYAFIIMPPFL